MEPAGEVIPSWLMLVFAGKLKSLSLLEKMLNYPMYLGSSKSELVHTYSTVTAEA